MKGDTFFEKLRDHSPAYVSAFCAFMMLCFVPIVYRNAFFDINRIKVYSVYAIIPLTLVLMLFAVLFRKNNRKTNLQDRSILICFGAMAVFLVSCLLSCLFSGFSAAVLLGNQGRYCGFLFLLCCGAAFYLIACPGISGKHILPAIELTVGLVALLGVLNAMGIDPLGFYDRIKRGQEQMFMSTIGHFDFFGTYMVMLFPLCAGTFLFSGKRICRWFGFVCCVLSLMGAAAARTDSALLGIQMGCAALVALSGGSFFRLSKALIVWAIAFFSLPVVGFLMKNGAFGLTYSGPHKLLCEQGIAYFAGAVLFSAAVFCWILGKRHIKAPGRRRMTALVLVSFLLVVLLLLMAMAYFTLIAPDAEIGAASGFLRYSDEWGSYRGFVYTRAMSAYGSYTFFEKLFGKGLDTTKLILQPYFDHPVISIVGVFDDTHNQLLQFLLTGGILAAASFTVFYGVVLYTLYRRAGDDPLICGVTASVCAYLIVMLINVTQPILIVTYFALSALALSRITYLEKRRRTDQ